MSASERYPEDPLVKMGPASIASVLSESVLLRSRSLGLTVVLTLSLVWVLLLGCQPNRADSAASLPVEPTETAEGQFQTRVRAEAERESVQSPGEASSSGAAIDPDRSAVSEPLRLVALGDVHGDLEALQAALRLAGLLDVQGHWSGGESILVQTGDLLDRGDDEPEILALLRALQLEAEAAGGRVVLLLGNHELMNVQNDLRYVTKDGFADYAEHGELGSDSNHCPHAMKESERARCLAFRPGGELARGLAEFPVIVQVAETVFVHGGLLEAHVDYGIARINQETRAFLMGESDDPGEMMSSRRSPLWVRDWGQDEVDCEALRALLRRLGAQRMVIGHTVQAEGINQRCDGALWRIDAGLSAYYGRKLELLELVGEQAEVIRVKAGEGQSTPTRDGLGSLPTGERIP